MIIIAGGFVLLRFVRRRTLSIRRLPNQQPSQTDLHVSARSKGLDAIMDPSTSAASASLIPLGPSTLQRRSSLLKRNAADAGFENGPSYPVRIYIP